jgi:hypothetical protein
LPIPSSAAVAAKKGSRRRACSFTMPDLAPCPPASHAQSDRWLHRKTARVGTCATWQFADSTAACGGAHDSSSSEFSPGCTFGNSFPCGCDL